MKKLFVLFAFLALIAATSYSDELEDVSSEISAISVQGLKRTKLHVVEKPLQKFIGKDADNIDKNEVIAVIQSTGILEPLSVDIIDNENGAGKTLLVTVKEKLTIFPVPIVSVSSSGSSGGGVLMDANAFGIKDNMMVMGIFGKNDIMTGLMYIHSPNSTGELGWNFNGFFSMRENEITDQKEEKVFSRYNSISIHPIFVLSYSLTEHITPSLRFAYTNISLQDSDNKINVPKNGMQGITISPTISAQHNSWDGYFLNEKHASLRYEYTFVFDGADIHSVSASAAFNHSIIKGLRLNAKSGAVFSTTSASPFFDSSPSDAAVNILPRHYSATNIAGISLGLEQYLFKFKFGTITLSAAYQAVYSNSDFLSNQVDHGPVMMLQMYFSRLAIPGMGLGAAYNADKNVWQYAFNIGMMM